MVEGMLQWQCLGWTLDPLGHGCGCTPQDWAPLARYLLVTCNLHWFLSLLTSHELPKAYGQDYFLLILKKNVNRINPLIFLVCLRVTPLNFGIKPPPPIISMLYVFCLVFLLDLTNYHKPYDWKQHKVILQFRGPQVQCGSHGLKSQCRQDGISSGDCREDQLLSASSSLEAAHVPRLLAWHHSPCPPAVTSFNFLFCLYISFWFWLSSLAPSLLRTLVILLRWPE